MSVPTLDDLIKDAQTSFDLTEPTDQKSLYELSNQLLELPEVSSEQLREAARRKETPLEFKIAAKLVESKRFLVRNDQPVRVGIVFAMWGEQHRLLAKSSANPHGEDALRVKLHQLHWATCDSPVEWTVYAVDDGCPHGSGGIAAEIAAEHPLGNRVKVLSLADALPADLGPLAHLQSVDDSRKGGAVLLGCMQALADGMDAVIYTDADTSVHLGQIGLLLQKFIDDKARVLLGNRKDPDAVLVKQESRWGVGIKLLRHMQRMVGHSIFSQGILDTQAAFKLYHCDVLQKIIQQPTVYDFSFDTDWILAAIAMNERFVKVPFAFIDSFAQSASITQGPMTTWETLLKGLVKAVRKHGVPHNQAMARVLDEEIRTSADLDLLIGHLPPELANTVDKDLGDPAVMPPEAVQAWIQYRKAEAVKEGAG
ncbi:MAG: glycosyltransferase [Candidatus Electrothrix sp. ATG2]|nr:glycosyltransferase [Candidatus Electrothrix sp. ATG2]